MNAYAQFVERGHRFDVEGKGIGGGFDTVGGGVGFIGR